MERCAFCGWNRKNAFNNIRFFGIPKEPGMKRIQWLYVLANRNINPKEKIKVCSVHFRSGRPSSDPSHEDFVPHLYIDQPPLPGEYEYIESLVTQKPSVIAQKKVEDEKEAKKLKALEMEASSSKGPSILRKPRPQTVQNVKEEGNSTREDSDDPFNDDINVEDPSEHPVASNGITNENNSSSREMGKMESNDQLPGTSNPRRIKVQLVPPHVVKAANLTPGVSVILRKYIR
uniref:THAP-type domain-containing protein n=1 Tax=Rhabditophanes sp. KR3021 TaxID=114890 RepID=A0AC35TUY0_9BILA